MLKLSKKGQNIAEYSVLIAIVIAAAVGMQVYVKRGLQGKMKDVVDSAPSVQVDGTTIDFKTKQYEPSFTASAGVVNSPRSLAETHSARGGIERNEIVENQARETGAYESTEWDAATMQGGVDETPAP